MRNSKVCKFHERFHKFLTISFDTGGHPVPFPLHKKPSSLNFFNIQICIAVGAFLTNSLTNAYCTVLFDCV